MFFEGIKDLLMDPSLWLFSVLIMYVPFFEEMFTAALGAVAGAEIMGTEYASSLGLFGKIIDTVTATYGAAIGAVVGGAAGFFLPIGTLLGLAAFFVSGIGDMAAFLVWVGYMVMNGIRFSTQNLFILFRALIIEATPGIGALSPSVMLGIRKMTKLENKRRKKLAKKQKAQGPQKKRGGLMSYVTGSAKRGPVTKPRGYARPASAYS